MSVQLQSWCGFCNSYNYYYTVEGKKTVSRVASTAAFVLPRYRSFAAFVLLRALMKYVTSRKAIIKLRVVVT